MGSQKVNNLVTVVTYSYFVPFLSSYFRIPNILHPVTGSFCQYVET
jgi:hypothetical protein